LSPGTEAGPIVGADVGRDVQVDGRHCPAPLPAGNTAEAILVPHVLGETGMYWATYQNVQSSKGSLLMLL